MRGIAFIVTYGRSSDRVLSHVRRLPTGLRAVWSGRGRGDGISWVVQFGSCLDATRVQPAVQSARVRGRSGRWKPVEGKEQPAEKDPVLLQLTSSCKRAGNGGIWAESGRTEEGLSFEWCCCRSDLKCCRAVRVACTVVAPPEHALPPGLLSIKYLVMGQALWSLHCGASAATRALWVFGLGLPGPGKLQRSNAPTLQHSPPLSPSHPNLGPLSTVLLS